MNQIEHIEISLAILPDLIKWMSPLNAVNEAFRKGPSKGEKPWRLSKNWYPRYTGIQANSADGLSWFIIIFPPYSTHTLKTTIFGHITVQQQPYLSAMPKRRCPSTWRHQNWWHADDDDDDDDDDDNDGDDDDDDDDGDGDGDDDDFNK